MKKGIFKGNIKHEYVSYIWVSIILVAFIGVSVGTLLLYAALKHAPCSEDRIGLLIFSVLAYLYGILSSSLIIFVIRKYPKYPKLRKLCLDSDIYFVGSDSKEFRGHWRGRAIFDKVTQLAKQNEGLEDIKYPKKYRVYIVLTVIGIVLMFAYLAFAYIALKNMDMLPKAFQREVAVFAVLIIMEVFNMILSFVFAFRVKNIRKDVIEEYKRRK